LILTIFSLTQFSINPNIKMWGTNVVLFFVKLNWTLKKLRLRIFMSYDFLAILTLSFFLVIFWLSFTFVMTFSLFLLFHSLEYPKNLHKFVLPMIFSLQKQFIWVLFKISCINKSFWTNLVLLRFEEVMVALLECGLRISFDKWDSS
jgi:hypothetical protein